MFESPQHKLLADACFCVLSFQLKMTGRARGPVPGLEAKPPNPGSQRDRIESILMEDTERLLVESCYGNCLHL